MSEKSSYRSLLEQATRGDEDAKESIRKRLSDFTSTGTHLNTHDKESLERDIVDFTQFLRWGRWVGRALLAAVLSVGAGSYIANEQARMNNRQPPVNPGVPYGALGVFVFFAIRDYRIHKVFREEFLEIAALYPDDVRKVLRHFASTMPPADQKYIRQIHIRTFGHEPDWIPKFGD